MLVRKSTVARLENFRLRKPEFVDALLHIADHEEIVFPFDACNQSLLQQIAVLIFIYKNICKFFSVIRSGLLVLQNLKGKMLDVTEIHHAAFFFETRKNVPVVLHDFQEKRSVGEGFPYFRMQIRKAVIEIIFFERCHGILQRNPCRFQLFLKFLEFRLRVGIVRFEIFFQK